MTLNEYQDKNPDKDIHPIKGSYFTDEIYLFDNADDKLPVFVEMLKQRGYFIGKDWHIHSPKGKIASKLMRNGYYMTSAQYDKKMYYFMEHRAIWVWHNGSIPKGLVVNHKDYNRWNNNIENLELLTQKENVEYSRCHHKSIAGELSGKSIYTNKQAAAMKTMSELCGWNTKKICDFVGGKEHNISRIVKGTRYPNVISVKNILEVYPEIVRYTMHNGFKPYDDLCNYLMGLAGEAGEVCDLFKKKLYHGHDISDIDILDELGDVLYYVTAIGNLLGFDMAEILLNNERKVMARYPDGFSSERSIGRIEEDARGVIDGNGDNR